MIQKHHYKHLDKMIIVVFKKLFFFPPSRFEAYQSLVENVGNRFRICCRNASKTTLDGILQTLKNILSLRSVQSTVKKKKSVKYALTFQILNLGFLSSSEPCLLYCPQLRYAASIRIILQENITVVNMSRSISTRHTNPFSF